MKICNQKNIFSKYILGFRTKHPDLYVIDLTGAISLQKNSLFPKTYATTLTVNLLERFRVFFFRFGMKSFDRFLKVMLKYLKNMLLCYCLGSNYEKNIHICVWVFIFD